MALDKLIIGTVNFGIPYGTVPGSGQVPAAQAATIVAAALEMGIGEFDTAAGYGDAETVLGTSLAQATGTSAKVVSKILPLPDGKLDAAIETTIVEQIHAARARLGVGALDAVLVHRVADLLGPHGPRLWGVLQQARADGLARRIGVSVYEASEIDAVMARFNPEVVQLPLSIADQRLVRSGHLSALDDAGVEIHARSVFLQGVLLARLEAIDPIFTGAADELAALDAVARATGITRLALCLAFVARLPAVSKIVVGVNTVEQFRDVAAAVARPCAIDPVETDRCAWRDERLLNPSNWSRLKKPMLSEA